MLVIRKSRIKGAGRGLFTTSRIRKGDVIVEYLGEKLTWKQCLKRYKKDLTKLLYVFCINDDNCVDAKYTPDELAQYANDANGTPKEKRKYENNCEYNIIKGKPYIVATKNIPANAEILVDYGDDYWEAVTENKEAKEKKSQSRKENPKSRSKTKKTKGQHAADAKKLLQPLIDPDALPKSRSKTKKKKDRTHRSEYKRKKSSRALI